MITIFNSFISGIGVILGDLLGLLPNSPFTIVSGLDNYWIGVMNYWLPINSMVAHMELYVTAVGIYYLQRVILRWVRAIE